jgi:hypothetical protein
VGRNPVQQSSPALEDRARVDNDEGDQRSLDNVEREHALLEYDYGTTNNTGNLLSQNIRLARRRLRKVKPDGLDSIDTASETGGWSQTNVKDPFGNLRRSDLTLTFDANRNQTKPNQTKPNQTIY